MAVLKRILKKTAVFIVVLALVSTILYWFFGLRILVSGGGQPRLGFVKSAESLADEIERHRAAQRASLAGHRPRPPFRRRLSSDATAPAMRRRLPGPRARD